MAKKRQDEVAFGSDSFLDVVANIVGILIILIVVAGVRVSHTPTPVEVKEPVAVAVVENEEKTVEETPDAMSEIPIDVLLVEEIEKPQPPPPEIFAPMPVVAIPQQIVEKIQELSVQESNLKQKLDFVVSNTELIQNQQLETIEDVQKLRSELASTTDDLKIEQEKLETAKQISMRNAETVAILKQKITATSSKPVEKETLQHRLPPISKLVTGKEIHFRLIDQRFSHVPLERLSEQLKRDVMRRRDFILSQTIYRGTSGPLEGYEMDFLMKRQLVATFDQTRLGRVGGSMELSAWVIRPQSTLVTETFEEAIQINSRFRNTILSVGTSATVTLWVYQDSFELHQQLKSYLHDSGFMVATRILPDGVPIAFSPSGSRSRAQ